MNYLNLKQESDKLIKNAINEFFKNNNTKNSRYGMPENIDGLEIDNTILILGLNPSSVNIEDTEKQNSCFIKYLDININKNIRKSIDKFTYSKYFKPNYELVKDLGYNLLWKNKEYLDRQIKKRKINEDAKKLLYNNVTKSNKFIIFADLIYFVETKSKEVNKILKNLKDDIWMLLNLQIKYYRPKMIICTNANVSKFICGYIEGVDMNKIEPKTYDILNGIPIVYSGMVSSGVLDQFNKIRLKREIEKIYNKEFMYVK